jgi:enamine deaminase RidA (YjgF/YER057c/UK114 family)
VRRRVNCASEKQPVPRRRERSLPAVNRSFEGVFFRSKTLGAEVSAMKIKRSKTFSGTPWESIVGYARAVQVGDWVYVSGTTGTDPTGKVMAPGDPYQQTVHAIRNIEGALTRLGLSLEHVVRSTIYVRDINHWEEVAKAHQEFFGKVHPATSLVAVTGLVNPEMLVEIEAVAVS